MKCPICGKELYDAGDAEYSVQCLNENCYFGQNRQYIYGSEELFEKYNGLKQALDIAVEALKDFSIHPDNSVKKYANKVLEQITEQKGE